MARAEIGRVLLPWWLGGLLLGLTQILAVGVAEPLGVSTQFVVADTQVLDEVAPAYVRGHPLIGGPKYQHPGYGWWLDIGLIAGALGAAVATGTWKLRTTTVWWEASHGASRARRFIACFLSGFLIVLGARFASGCTSGQFASGWTQLSLSAIPFTVTMFAFGLLAARLAHPRIPDIEG